jgi:hypothetical protein
LIKSLLKSSLLATIVFTLSWVRSPLSRSPVNLLGIFLWSGILITIFSMIIGIPIVRLLVRLRAGLWWVYLLAAAACGGLLAAIFSSHPTGGIENPHAIAFSPWTRDTPGLFDGPPLALADYVGSIVFGAIVGGLLGISFWYFYSRGTQRVSK